MSFQERRQGRMDDAGAAMKGPGGCIKRAQHPCSGGYALLPYHTRGEGFPLRAGSGLLLFGLHRLESWGGSGIYV
ncbi:hypothetical protein E2C01_099504 [Portunus trituberculatus]|uniref:Uncharacterized protein n=1 Tax=Portunus trituberculatus TaxID=210409 RepID=A0A5B7KF54_PORTR|nr:hypothetical protein [Portunus trituberculatus]